MSDETGVTGLSEIPSSEGLPVAPNSITAEESEAKHSADSGNGTRAEATSAPGEDLAEDTTMNGTPAKEVAQDPAKAEDLAEVKTDDVAMDESTAPEEAAPTSGDGAVADATPNTPASTSKSKSRRRSNGIPEHKSKKLNKRQSMTKLLHLDAKAGDHYMYKMKGYPWWPVVICDEEMLPPALLSSRPVTAAKADGSYREDYEKGGKNAIDRTYPAMFLATNEFCWALNTDLREIDPEAEGDGPKGKKSGPLYDAHILSAEGHDLDYYKEILNAAEEAKKADMAAREAKLADAQAKAEAKAEAKTSKSTKVVSKGKRKSTAAADADDEEPTMADGDVMDVDEDTAKDTPKTKSKKRKVAADDEDTSTPQRTDSAKKPKIKLTTKSNGTSTPKSASKKDEGVKSAKSKTKKVAKSGSDGKTATPVEPELSVEEKRVKKEKEILFLRHKLQKGLLTKEQELKADEMKQMSEYITKLEGYADLEVAIIRATKINKVLKAIKKLESIPKEEDYNFKSRSESLLQKWNKILETETGSPAAPATNGDANGKSSEPKEAPSATNGVANEGTAENSEGQAADITSAEATKAEIKVAEATTDETAEEGETKAAETSAVHEEA